MKDRYGLEQISGDAEQIFYATIEGDLVVWQVARLGVQSEIYAYNLSTQTWTAVAVEENVYWVAPALSGGRVVYARNPSPLADANWTGSRMFLWDSRTGERVPIETGMEGSGLAGFDGTWVLFTTAGGPNGTQGTLWAMRLSDQRKVLVYETNAFERSMALDVADGFAYVGTHRRDGKGAFNTTLRQVNLSTGAVRVLQFVEQYQMDRMDASEHYVVWSSGSKAIWAVDLKNGTAWIASSPADRGPVFPRVGEGWAVYNSFTQGPQQDCLAVHLATGTRYTLAPGDGHLSCMNTLHADGHRFVVNVSRSSYYGLLETSGGSLYVGTLPDIKV